MAIEIITTEHAVKTFFKTLRETFLEWSTHDHMGYVGDGFGYVVSIMDHSTNELLFFRFNGKWSIGGSDIFISDAEVEQRLHHIYSRAHLCEPIRLDIILYTTFIEGILEYMERLNSDSDSDAGEKRAKRLCKILYLESNRQGTVKLSKVIAPTMVDVKLSGAVLGRSVHVPH